MTWYTIEFLLFTNLLFLLIPLSSLAKKYYSLFVSLLLSSLFFFFLTLQFNFTTILSLKTLLNDTFGDGFSGYVVFGFPILFVLDNITTPFVFLTTFLISICYLINWKNRTYNSTLYLLIIWFLEFALIHTFTSLNLLLFYVFFEISLIPMFLLILIWGSRQRKVHAAYLFFFYTAAGSFFLLLGLLYLYFSTNTLFIPTLLACSLDYQTQFVIWSLFFVGFAFKVPLVPLHTWLPEAHVEAPTVGSIILAGLLLKVGTFGMLRFMFPLLNAITLDLQPLIFFFSLLSIYHASIIALRQIDLKKLIAYSSVAHMGFVILGLFSLNIYGISGAVYIMFSHGIVASALFFFVGVLYDRYKTRNILEYGGLVSVMPIFVIFLFFFILANLSFPGSSNFIGELLVLFGITEINLFVSLLATFSIVFTSAYSIWLFNRVSFGFLQERLRGFADLNKVEFYVSLFFLGLMLIFGFCPNLLLTNFDNLVFTWIREPVLHEIYNV